ncbi:unnamed protein product [Dovyalis caffra]|uniref:Wall-associated receptor kinase galacturonan-binding domain-containing protein n=1 Tax=Dovyalis caffra TaxID=77055 RepID=A0AAV1QM07_9ROSI|nr:unnamed protein product [Dovyalis caffra]
MQNISNPFRLDTDPKNCGNYNYTLYSENNTSAILYLYAVKYYVQAINYENFTVRVVEAGIQKGNCSSLSLADANVSTLEGRFSPYYYKWSKYRPPSLYQFVIFVNCENPVNSTLYVDTAPCLNYGVSNSSNSSPATHYYVVFGGTTASDLMERCSMVKRMPLREKDYTNMSFKEIYSDISYGFELSCLCQTKPCPMGTRIYQLLSPVCTHFISIDGAVDIFL